MSTLRSFAWVGVLLAAAPLGIASAQTTPRSSNDPCYRARPSPDCSVFFLTNAGLYINPRSTNYSTPWRGIVDWGVMVNVGPRDAIGGSWFVSLDEDDFMTGPEVRYRRWFGGDRSLDVAVGTPLYGGGELKAGSALGLVKYNPVHWFGVAVRPEYLRRTAYDFSQPPYGEYTATSTRIYAGVEFGWFPGLALSLGGGAALGVLVAALSGS